MSCMRLFAVGMLAAMPVVGWSYDSGFTLDFEVPGDTAGWEDLAHPVNMEIFAGENVSVDNPPHSTPPESAANYNGTDWLRLGASAQTHGVGTYTYDGRAGGSSTVTSPDYVIEGDVYIDPLAPYRYQVALFGNWNAGTGSAPPEIFYSHGTPGQPNGFGWRHGVPQQYGAFPELTAAQWVRLRLQVSENMVTMSVDLDIDGTYEHVSAPMTLSGVNQTSPGRIGFQLVLNDPANSSLAVANQFAYFDNLSYTPMASVSEWSLY